MANTILFVFEGERTEKRIFNALKKEFLASGTDDFVVATYNAEIYQLWREIDCDEYLDVVELIREKNNGVLAGLSREDIDQVYLFFDYDGHAPNAADDKITAMLNLFDNETEHGMLYVSYPMVEAFRDINNGAGYENNIVASQERDYKRIVGGRGCYTDVRKLNTDAWRIIISANLKKSNLIVNGSFSFPGRVFTQLEIFENQYERFIANNLIAVLSAFPFFVVEYFGIDAILERWSNL